MSKEKLTVQLFARAREAFPVDFNFSQAIATREEAMSG